MKLCIPSIGDKILLTKNWTFSLYTEYRNETLFKALGIESIPLKKPEDFITTFRDIHPDKIYLGLKEEWTDDEILQILSQEWDRINLANSTNGTYNVRVIDLMNKWHRGSFSTPVTLPKGTVLTVDRLYIRKGATNFDSLSFYIGNAPKGVGFKKQGKIRFWAKLPDVNKINFSPIPA